MLEYNPFNHRTIHGSVPLTDRVFHKLSEIQFYDSFILHAHVHVR